jgi:hypothetical protein
LGTISTRAVSETLRRDTLRQQAEGLTAGAFSIQPLEVSPVWNLDLMGFGWS